MLRGNSITGPTKGVVTWDSSNISALADLLPGTSVKIRLTVKADTEVVNTAGLASYILTITNDEGEVEVGTKAANPEAIDGFKVVNTACVEGRDESGFRVVSSSNPAIMIIREPKASIDVKKTASTGVIVPGEELTYTITVLNDGWQDLANVVVIDTLPAGLTYHSSNFDPERITHPEDLRWKIANLPIGSYEEIRLTVNTRANVNDYTASNPTNTVVVVGWDESGDSQTATAIESLPIQVKVSRIDITKTASQSVIIPGEPVTYTRCSSFFLIRLAHFLLQL
ncbi:MAG: DUF11 domain-containing protein, partial [bacterium]|nr:DUF11 domain-containing protein [bacterium]